MARGRKPGTVIGTEDLWNAIIKSEKSFDEILKFINAGQKNEDD